MCPYCFINKGMQEPQCTRCGQCCRKGGPLLHLEDLHLIEQENVLYSQLVALRTGELIHDPVLGKLQPLEQEVIKISGNNSSKYPWHCVLHKGDGCALHPLRPLQCKILFCQDSSAVQNMYTKDRAMRKHIFKAFSGDKASQEAKQVHAQQYQESPQVLSQVNTEGWLELALAHEEECSLPPLVQLAETVFLRNELDLKMAEQAEIVRLAEEKILQSVRYDLNFRELCVQRAGIASEFLPCILGRPVHVFLRSLGIKIYADKQGELTVNADKKGIYFSILNAFKTLQ